MEYFIYSLVGLAAGLFGGLLGIGGSIIIIPALTLIFGPDQHLYQAAAMICNFFVALGSLLSHIKARALSMRFLKPMAPAAVIGVLLGVSLSNMTYFTGDKSYRLARVFGAFLVYVVIYNTLRLFSKGRKNIDPMNPRSMTVKHSVAASIIGATTGCFAGMLGIGAGTVSTPLQQLALKMPLRNAMSLSAGIIACIAPVGAVYKNLSLSVHGESAADSLVIAAFVLPPALIGGVIGGKMMHLLPKNAVRTAFIIVAAFAAVRMLTAG